MGLEVHNFIRYPLSGTHKSRRTEASSCPDRAKQPITVNNEFYWFRGLLAPGRPEGRPPSGRMQSCQIKRTIAVRLSTSERKRILLQPYYSTPPPPRALLLTQRLGPTHVIGGYPQATGSTTTPPHAASRAVCPYMKRDRRERNIRYSNLVHPTCRERRCNIEK
jgi:hypothetical protein